MNENNLGQLLLPRVLGLGWSYWVVGAGGDRVHEVGHHFHSCLFLLLLLLVEACGLEVKVGVGVAAAAVEGDGLNVLWLGSK